MVRAGGTALALVVALAAPSADASPTGRVLFHLTDPRIDESSGIAVATREPGVWFTHNDSGDSARFFALGADGRTLTTYDVDGVKAVDWEDMAAAPLKGVPTLWFADIGDNDGTRPEVSVYAVREPVVVRGASGVTVHVKSVRYRFRYPDGPRDAETLMVDPRTSRIYLASKPLDGDTHVYVAPAHPSTTAVNALSNLADVQWVPRARGPIADLVMQVLTTGGDFSPDGRSFVLRTYSDAYLFRLHGSGPRALAHALASPPVRIRLPDQLQGEGVSFRRDGKAIVISSEHAGTAVDEVLLPQAPPSATPTATRTSAAPTSPAAPASAAAATSVASPARPYRHGRPWIVVAAALLAAAALAAAALRTRRTRA